MNLTDKILDHENLMRALHQIKNNKGKAGIDGMFVEELDLYFFGHEEEICAQIRERRYCPLPVKRVYIEKPNSNKKRPLGIEVAIRQFMRSWVILMQDMNGSLTWILRSSLIQSIRTSLYPLLEKR